MDEVSKKRTIEKIKWQSDWSVGNDMVDKQHRKIISYINALIDLYKEPRDIECLASQKIRLNDTFNELFNYTETHFRDEEALLAQYNYPQLDEHRRIHQHLIEQLTVLRNKSYEFGLDVLPALIAFLKTWLIEHILGIDMKYSKIVGQRDIGRP